MKKLFAFLFSIVLVVSITGCASGNPASSPKRENHASGEGSDNTTETGKDSDKPTSNGSLVWRVDGALAETVNTEDGHYFIGSEEDEENQTIYTIRYVDYKTKQEIYLCNQPNCKHNTNACNAVLPEEATMGGSYLFADDDYLYLAVTPADSAGSVTQTIISNEDTTLMTPTDTTPPVIYRMKFDGTDREKIFSMDSGYVMEPVFFSDSHALYMVAKKVSEEKDGDTTYATGYDRKLLRYDMESKKSEEVMDLDNEQSILGVSGRQVVIGMTDYGREVTVKEKQDDAAFKKLFENSEYIITSQNIDTKKAVELKRYKQDKLHSERIRNGILYSSYEGKKEISMIDLATNEEKILPTKQSYQIEYVLEQGVGMYAQDEQARDTTTVIASPWDVGEEGYSNYFINVKEGTETKSKLQNRYHRPVEILAENADFLYVVSDYEEVKEYVSWMDIYQDVIGKVTYSIISKKDFCENNASYENVKVIGMGEWG